MVKALDLLKGRLGALLGPAAGAGVATPPAEAPGPEELKELAGQLREEARRELAGELGRGDARCYWCVRPVRLLDSVPREQIVRRTQGAFWWTEPGSEKRLRARIAVADHLVRPDPSSMGADEMRRLSARENLIVSCRKCRDQRSDRQGREPRRALQLPHCFWCGAAKESYLPRCPRCESEVLPALKPWRGRGLEKSARRRRKASRPPLPPPEWETLMARVGEHSGLEFDPGYVARLLRTKPGLVGEMLEFGADTFAGECAVNLISADLLDRAWPENGEEVGDFYERLREAALLKGVARFADGEESEAAA